MSDRLKAFWLCLIVSIAVCGGCSGQDQVEVPAPGSTPAEPPTIAPGSESRLVPE